LHTAFDAEAEEKIDHLDPSGLELDEDLGVPPIFHDANVSRSAHRRLDNAMRGVPNFLKNVQAPRR
jgi:hypothetical protein